MRNLYQLKIVNRNRYSIDTIRKFFLQIHRTRNKIVEFYNFARKENLGISQGAVTRPLHDARYNAKMSLQANNGYYVLTRNFNGEILKAERPVGLTNNMKEMLNEIRETIKETRRSLRFTEDTLLNRPVGYYLNKYIQTCLQKAKVPTSNVLYTGIEVECILPRNTNMSPLLPFAKWVNVGTDGSIDYDSSIEEGREIRICAKKSELKTIIPPIMQALQSMGAKVNKSCGLHVHLDQRSNQNVSVSFKSLVHSLGLLYTVVPKSRRNNRYCEKNHTSNFERARQGNRYRAVNATAYYRYNTIEVRLFGGTLQADKILNWIETLWGIANGTPIGRCPKSFDTANKYWNLSDNTVTWLKARQEQFAALNVNSPISESDSEIESNVVIDDMTPDEIELQEVA